MAKSRYIAAFSLVTLVFFLGLFLGNLISQSKISDLEDSESKLNTLLISLELKDKLTEQNFNCNLSYSQILKEKVELGEIVTSLEGRFGKNNAQVLKQKELYELLEIRTLLLLQKINKECNQNISIILFFYTNDESNKLNFKQSENQGYVLDAISSAYPEKGIILVFDVGIPNPAVISLMEAHNVKTTPSLVINEKLYEGFVSLEELKNILGLK